jgi:hypothetical protein
VGLFTMEGGYALPDTLTAIGESNDVRVEIAVELADGRAHAQSVTVSRPGGVSSTTLRLVPVRDIMAWALLISLMRIERDGSNVTLTPINDPGDAEVALIKQLVGYVEVPR